MGLPAILLKWDRNISRDFETFVLFLICTRIRVYSPLRAIENSDTVRTSRENQEYVTIRCVRVSIVVLYRDCPSFSFLIGLLSLEFHIIFPN